MGSDGIGRDGMGHDRVLAIRVNVVERMRIIWLGV